MSRFSRWPISALFQISCSTLKSGVLVIAIGLLARLPAPLAAQIIDWNNITGGVYATAGNGNPTNVPDRAGETAQFDLAGTYRITFNANSSTTIDDLLISDGDVTFSNTGSVNDATLNIFASTFIEGGDLTLARIDLGGQLTLGERIVHGIEHARNRDRRSDAWQ